MSKVKSMITNKLSKLFNKVLVIKGGNTQYEIKCPDCGYTETMMIGGGHTSDSKGCFYNELGYCPNCKEPLEKGHLSFFDKSDGEDKTYNDVCPKCGEKTKTYNINKDKVQLVCPKCHSEKLEITDLESFWMT